MDNTDLEWRQVCRYIGNSKEKFKKQKVKSKIHSKMKNEKEKFKQEYKKRLYTFTLKIIKLIENLPNDNTCRRLGDQLLRSGTSIIANYIEGQSSNSKKDLINYFSTCLKSMNESKVWLSLLKDLNKITDEEAKWFLGELNEFSNVFATSIMTNEREKNNFIPHWREILIFNF